MTTNEADDDDDDIDCEEEEELLRRDVVRLLEEIAFLEETSSSSSLRNGELESRLETLEQNRVSIARRMTTMKKKKKKQSGNNNNDDDDYGTTAFSLLSSRIHEVAEYVDSAVRNTVVSNQRKTREENILRELDLFVDGDEDAIETNTIRGKEVNEEKENRVEWIRKFGIENSMMMSGGKMDEEDLNAERSLRAFEMNDDEKGGVRKSGKEKGVVFLLDDDAHKVGLTIPKRDPYFTEWDQNNYGKAEYPAETGNVIIFPSMMFHETGKNTKDIPRLSISGDIMLTMKEGVKSEHNIPSPATWMKL